MTTNDDIRAVATELLRKLDEAPEQVKFFYGQDTIDLVERLRALVARPVEQECCIDDVAHAEREPSDGDDLFIRCDKHQRRERLAEDYYSRHDIATCPHVARPRPMPRTNPQHDCEYIDNPEKGACDLCEAFGDMYERGWNDCMMVARPLDARPVDEPPTTGYLHADRMSECGHCEPEKYMNAAPLEVCNCKCHAPIVPSASSPTNERVERTTDWTESATEKRLRERVERLEDLLRSARFHPISDELQRAITEELGRSHKEKV